MTDFLEELRVLRRQKPFAPFTIVLKDGRRFTMKRSLQCAFTDDRVVAFVYPDQDVNEFFRPSDIAALESAQPVG
jgi:hypothetical protein